MLPAGTFPCPQALAQQLEVLRVVETSFSTGAPLDAKAFSLVGEAEPFAVATAACSCVPPG